MCSALQPPFKNQESGNSLSVLITEYSIGISLAEWANKHMWQCNLPCVLVPLTRIQMKWYLASNYMSYCVQLKTFYMLYWNPGLLKCNLRSKAVSVIENSFERADIIIYYRNLNWLDWFIHFFNHNTKYMPTIKYILKLMWLHLKDFCNGDAVLSSVCAPSTASTFKGSL